MMWGVIAEAEEDFSALKVLIRRIKNNQSLKISGRGFKGCGQLLNKGAMALQLTRDRGAVRFIVCHDADGSDPESIRQKLQEKITRPCGFDKECCLVVPVKEFEAWIIADEVAITKVLSGFKMTPEANPENIENPKEFLVRLTRKDNGRPRYIPSTHNSAIAKHLRIDVVSRKCPSFRHFAEFVEAA